MPDLQQRRLDGPKKNGKPFPGFYGALAASAHRWQQKLSKMTEAALEGHEGLLLKSCSGKAMSMSFVVAGTKSWKDAEKLTVLSQLILRDVIHVHPALFHKMGKSHYGENLETEG